MVSNMSKVSCTLNFACFPFLLMEVLVQKCPGYMYSQECGWNVFGIMDTPMND